MKYTERSMTDFSQSERQIQSPSRAFASNNQDLVGSVIKCKSNKTSKVSNLPINVFVYNGEIVSEEAIRKVSEKINWQYYIDRAYEKISC